MGRTALPPCLCSCGSFEVREITWGGGHGPTVEAGLPYRKDVPCGRYDLAAPGLHLQRELTFVLFIARVFIVISD